jgi:serine/threonine protein phosphatase PrpC
MPQRYDPRLDAASALSVGRRAQQEDAVICDCSPGTEVGLVVLSDGMGGYCFGDMASKIVLTEVYSELKLRSAELAHPEADCRAILRGAAEGANACLRAYVEESPEAAGMGATLVAGVVKGLSLYWVSVGDSPLYLFRGGDLLRLNEDHSFGSVMRAMVADGRMEAAAAERHPERTSLISVLSGGPIPHVDCPRTPFRLHHGDVLLFASDGLMHVEDAEIRRVLRARRDAPSADIASALLRAVEGAGDPDQDNISVVVVRVGAPTARDGIGAGIDTAVTGAVPGARTQEAGRQRDAALCGGDGEAGA